MKIAVYGGSFNPPHLGHVEAARTVAQALHPDKFLIIPDNLPPHKEMVEDSPTPEQRMSLCALAFAAGVLYRKRVGEREIGSAEEEATRIINEAIRGGENRKKELLLEAKDEIHKSRTEYEK